MTVEELAKQLQKEYEEMGDPVTDEEALEIARMEMGAKEIKNYTQGLPEKKERKPREKKIDEDKKSIIELLAKALVESGYNATITNIDKTIDFDCYTVNLVKHRPPKKK